VLLQPGTAGQGFQGCSFGMAGEPTGHLLSFTVPLQLLSNWVRAAGSAGVAHYYDSASTVTQCQVVNAQLGRTDCCKNPASSNCNVTGYLDKALTYVGHLSSEQGSAAAYSAMSAAVDAGTPPCIRI